LTNSDSKQESGATGRPGTGSCAIVLPGGGARGAYQVGVLKAIAEIHGGQESPFGVICGTSAGAINAAVLASHAHEFAKGVERLEKFWGDMYCARIYRTDARTVFTSGLGLALTLASGGLLNLAPRALLDNSPLRKFLQSMLQLDGIETAIGRGALRGVSVTASGYTSARAISFFQGQQDIESWQRHRRMGMRQDLSVAHLMASAALPMLFPAERLGNEYFGDGGMRMIAPLSPAIHLGAERILVIGTRDEHPDPAPQTPTDYPSPGEIGGYLLDTIFMDTLNADLARLKRINRTLSLMPQTARSDSSLRPIDTFIIRPSRDLRVITAEHASAIPWAVRVLLRTLGGWGKEWRMPSYLLFEAEYCQELIRLGYADAQRDQRRIRDFLTGH
jgi:NTE family protein